MLGKYSQLFFAVKSRLIIGTIKQFCNTVLYSLQKNHMHDKTKPAFRKMERALTGHVKSNGKLSDDDDDNEDNV